MLVNPWTAWSAIEGAKLKWCSPMMRPALFRIGKANHNMPQTQRQCPKNKRDAHYQGLRSPWNPARVVSFRLSAVWNVDDAFASNLHLNGFVIKKRQQKKTDQEWLSRDIIETKLKLNCRIPCHLPNLHVSADFCGLAKSENCPNSDSCYSAVWNLKFACCTLPHTNTILSDWKYSSK